MAGVLGLLASCDDSGASTLVPRSGSSSAFCGNGVLEPGEGCDLGSANAVGRHCTPDCQPPRCGDGFRAEHEACDDGNLDDGDGCSSSCELSWAPRWSHALDVDGARVDQILGLAVTDATVYAVGERRDLAEGSIPVMLAADRRGRVRFIEQMDSSPGDAWASDVMATEDGDAVVVGQRTDEEGRSEPWAWRYGADGQLKWSRPLLDFGDADVAAIVPDGPKAIVGGTIVHEHREDAWFGRLDLDDGELTWMRRVEAPQRQFVTDLELLPDRTLVLAGSSGTTVDQVPWIATADLQGNIEWERHFGLDGAAEGQWWQGIAQAVAVGPDRDLYLTGSITTRLTDAESETTLRQSLWLARVDDDGREHWSRTHAGPDQVGATGEDLIVLEDGTIVTAGMVHTRPLRVPETWDRDAWIVAWSPEGTPLWTQSQDGPMHASDGANRLVRAGVDSLWVAGWTTAGLQSWDLWLAEVPMSGQALVGEPSVSTPSDDIAAGPSATAAATSEAPQRPMPRGRNRATLYLDFDGGELRPGTRGPLGEVPCIDGPLTYPGFAGDEQTATAIVEIVREAMSNYGVSVAWGERPPEHLPYTTVMIGGSGPQLGLPEGTAGYTCDVDCADSSSRDTVFAFMSGSAATMGRNVVHEAGHSWGLDHVRQWGRVMYPFSLGTKPDWSSDCQPLSEDTSPVQCSEYHQRFCPEGQQSSHAELLALFGPATPDVEPPTATILEPTDGDVLATGAPIEVEVEVEDDFGAPGWKLVVPGLGLHRVAWHDERELQLHLPAGRHRIELHAIDHAGHETVDAITLEVQGSREPLASADDERMPAHPGLPAPETSGHGCQIGGEGAPPPWWIFLGSLALVRVRDWARRGRAQAGSSRRSAA